jgi:hypothetical protein
MPETTSPLPLHQRRWDTDEVGHGVAGGDALRPELARLDDALAAPDWIAEQPDAHLLPHIRRACETPESGVRLVDWHVEDANLVVDLAVDPTIPGGDRRRPPQELLLPIVASFIETSSFVRIDGGPDGATLDLATGVLAGDSAFAPHGHLVRLRLATT